MVLKKGCKEISLDESKARSSAIVFFDFDNTVTTFDILDDIIERFSVNQDWMIHEKAWAAGKIGSKECLTGQLKSVRLTKSALKDYLSRVKLDPYFGKLLTLLGEKGIDHVIVSDSFSFIIKEILKNNGIKPIQVYSNRLRFQRDRLIPSFPFQSPFCTQCAHCKKTHVLENSDKETFYVGDGLSDICPAQEADWVFAKGTLLEHFKKTGKSCMPFKNLGDVYGYFQALNWLETKTKKILAVA